MINKFKTFLILVIFLTLGACTPPNTPKAVDTLAPSITPRSETIQLVDNIGKSITLTAPAQKIVSLSPAITESLFALGAGDQIVGRDTFSDYPEQAKNITDVGGGFGELNVEAILSQAPDLVLVSALTPPEQSKAMEDAGLTVFALGNPKDFDGLYNDLITLATLSGHDEEATQLIAGLKAAGCCCHREAGWGKSAPAGLLRNRRYRSQCRLDCWTRLNHRYAY